jgi:cytochrome c2
MITEDGKSADGKSPGNIGHGIQEPQRKGSVMKALLVVVIALLLLVGALTAVLMFSGGAKGPTRVTVLGDPVAGRQVALRPEINCVFCHSDDGSTMIGPTFKGMFGSTLKYDDGSGVVMDEAAIRYALKHPIDKIVDGYEPRMPELDSKMSETDKQNLIAYLASIGHGK